jgi:hypothetical protein
MSIDSRKEWLDKAAIDYNAPFLHCWLAFNAWYKGHFNDATDKKDRTLIDTVKNDNTRRNSAYHSYLDLICNDAAVSNKFRSDIEQFHSALSKAELTFDKKGLQKKPYKICLNEALDKHDDIKTHCLIKKAKRKPAKFIKLDDWFFTEQHELAFRCIIEAIYQIRCHLVHGSLSTSNEHHEAVRCAYQILYAIMHQMSKPS